MLIVVRRNLVSTFKIELVTPIGISIFLMQACKGGLSDWMLWIKAPIKSQNAIHCSSIQDRLWIRLLRKLLYFLCKGELEIEESYRVEHSDHPLAMINDIDDYLLQAHHLPYFLFTEDSK